jgi:hypothetical protein
MVTFEKPLAFREVIVAGHAFGSSFTSIEKDLLDDANWIK